jgi:hypothetical protein
MPKLLAYLAAGAAILAAIVPSATAAQPSRAHTFQLVEKDLSFHYQDNAPTGVPFQRVSAGDSFQFSSALMTRSNKRAGTLRAYCVFITGGTGANAASTCTGTFGLAGGTLEAQTTQRGDAHVTHIAIVGGTGVYEGATGSVTSVSRDNMPTRDTFHVMQP